MKKNLTTIVIFILFFASAIIKTDTGYAQVTESDNISNESIIYWFNINLRIMADPKTKIESYDVRRIGNKVYAGTIQEYDEKLWSNISKGGLIPVGPFYNYDEADQAKKFYNIGKEEKQDSMFQEGRTVYWFILHVKRRSRSKSWQLIRKPGAIAPGDYDTFESFLDGNLKLQVLTIGPFWNQPEAEESKRRYRLH